MLSGGLVDLLSLGEVDGPAICLSLNQMYVALSGSVMSRTV